MRAAVGLLAITFTSNSFIHSIKALKCDLNLLGVTFELVFLTCKLELEHV